MSSKPFLEWYDDAYSNRKHWEMEKQAWNAAILWAWRVTKDDRCKEAYFGQTEEFDNSFEEK